MKADTVSEQQLPPLEYTLEASSQEEGIFVGLPSPLIESKEYYDDDDHDNNNGGGDGNDDVRQRDGNAQHAGVGEHGNSPFDEARADHATAGGGATFSPDLLAAELNDAKRNKTSRGLSSFISHTIGTFHSTVPRDLCLLTIIARTNVFSHFPQHR